MPLINSKSKSAFSENVRREMAAGKPQKQALAISYSVQRRAGHANGGAVAEDAIKLAHEAARSTAPTARAAKDTPVGVPMPLAAGGMPEIPYFERQEARNVAMDSVHPGGLVASAGPGRTDIHNVSVAAGSYVLPADVVSGLGEGNTLNGAAVIDRMLSTGPYGTRLPPVHGGHNIPHPPAAFHDEEPSAVRFQPHFQSGGFEGKPIPIVIAGGEYVVPPSAVAKLGGGDVSRGHRVLDSFVIHVRKKTTKTLKKLPGPVK